jgi:HJR/Mrr/RecB family endonuclease
MLLRKAESFIKGVNMNSVKFNGVLKEVVDHYNEQDLATFLKGRLKIPDYKAQLLAERLNNTFDFAGMVELANRKNSISSIPRIEEKKANKFNIYALDEISGREFELFLKWLFEEIGFKVELTKIVADSGVDLVLSKDDEKIAVQAKRYRREIKVSNNTILKTHGGRDIYGCSKSIVVTTSYFTPQAVNDAKKLNVELWDRDSLSAKIDSINSATKTLQEKPRFPEYNNSLFKSLLALNEMGIFYVETKENGKYDIHRHGLRFPLVSFQVQALNRVTRCVLRIKDNKPIGECDSELIIWSKRGYVYGLQGASAYKKIVRYLSDFL